MKVKTAVLFTALALLLLFSSCIVTSQDIREEITCEDFWEEPDSLSDDFTVEIGDKITVKLCSNPTTGFKWKYETIGKIVLKEEDYDFEEPDEDIIGADGMEVWTFEAIEKGTTEIRMEYSRPWEGGEKSEWTYTLYITVE